MNTSITAPAGALVRITDQLDDLRSGLQAYQAVASLVGTYNPGPHKTLPPTAARRMTWS
jgi:hypothetical protein